MIYSKATAEVPIPAFCDIFNNTLKISCHVYTEALSITIVSIFLDGKVKSLHLVTELREEVVIYGRDGRPLQLKTALKNSLNPVRF